MRLTQTEEQTFELWAPEPHGVIDNMESWRMDSRRSDGKSICGDKGTSEFGWQTSYMYRSEAQDDVKVTSAPESAYIERCNNIVVFYVMCVARIHPTSVSFISSPIFLCLFFPFFSWCSFIAPIYQINTLISSFLMAF
jgi:hypothetical protein